MDTEIRKENKVQTGCDRFTSPEEISALSKYLKKKRQDLDDSISLGKDNLGVPGWRSGSLKEITSLSDKVEVLDTRGNSGIISKLKDNRETLTTNKNVGTLEKQRETILGNKKETTLDDDIENIAPGEKNASLETKREDLKINDKTSLSGYIESIIDNQKDPSLSNDRLDIGEIKDPNLKKERENVHFAKEIDKNLSLKRGKDAIIDLEIDEKQKLDYNLTERLKVEKTVDALQNKLLDIGKNFSENELKQQEENIIKGASGNGSLIWLSGENKEIESLKKPKNNIEGELPKLKSLGENKPISSANNENGEVETLKKTKNITIPGKIKDQPLSDTRENIEITELEKLSKDRENLDIKEKTELSSFRSDIKIEDEKGVKLSKEREEINNVKKVEIIGEPAEKLINKPKEEDEIKLEKDIESVQGKIQKDELNTSRENIIGETKEIKKLDSEPELLDIGKKNISLEDKKEKINGDILELKKLSQEKESIEVSDKVQELNTKREEVIDYPEDDKIKLSGEAIKKELEDKEISELESRVDRIETKEIRNLDSSLEQIQNKGKILNTPELSTAPIEKIDPKLIDSLDNDHLETLTPQVDINLPEQPAKKIIESEDKISALEDKKEQVVDNENIEPDKLSDTRLDLEEKEVDKLSDNSIKVLDGDKEIEDLSQNLENITESIAELEELSKKLVSVGDISEIEKLEDKKEQVVDNENIEPDKLSDTRLDLEEKEVDKLSNIRLDLTTEDVDLSDVLLDISPKNIDSLSNKLIDVEVTDSYNFEGQTDTNIDFRGEGLSKERLDLTTEDVGLKDELKDILPDDTTKLNGEGEADHAQFNPDTYSLYDTVLAVTETDIYNFEGQTDTNIDFKNEGLSKERLNLTTEDPDSLSDIRKNISPDDLEKVNYGSNYKRDEEDDETRDDYKHTGFQDSLSKSREDVEVTDKFNFDGEEDTNIDFRGEGLSKKRLDLTTEDTDLSNILKDILPNDTSKLNYGSNYKRDEEDDPTRDDYKHTGWDEKTLSKSREDVEVTDKFNFDGEEDTNIAWKDSLSNNLEKVNKEDKDKVNYGSNYKRDEEDDETRDDYKHTGFQDSLSKSREDVEADDTSKTNLSSDGTHAQFDPEKDKLYNESIKTAKDDTTKLNGEGKADHAQFETLEDGSLYDTNLGIKETDKFNFSDNTEQGSDNENLAWNKELSDNLENTSKDDESPGHKQFNPETDTLYRSAEKAKSNDLDKINYGPNHKRDEEDDPTRDDYKHTGWDEKTLSKSREDVEEEGDEHRQFDPDSDSLYNLAIQAEEDEKNTAENLKTILNSRNKSLDQYYDNILHFADNKALDKGWASKVKSLMSAYLSGGEVTKARADEFEQQLFKTILGDQGNVQMAEYKLSVSWTNGINISKYLRYVAEQAAGLVKSTSGTWVFGPNPYGKSSLRQTLLDTTLMTLVAARRVLEVSTKSNRDRLPGKDVGILQDVIGGGGTKELAKKAASKLTKSVINNVASAFGAQQIDTSLPMNRPEKWEDEMGWEYGNNRTNTSRGDKNNKDKNKSNSFSLKKLGNALAAAAGEALLGAPPNKEYDFQSNYMQGWGITTTLQDLAGVKPSDIKSVEDLRTAIQSSPYMNEPTKFTASKQNPGGNLITLDDNTHWEIILEPFCGEENGGYSYLPSLAEINIWNAAHHGVNTGYNKWIPFTSFDLSKSKMSTKSLNLFDGEIVYPISMEFTNELRLTIADDAYKSWRTYFERCSDAAIYSSEPHKIDYYSKESIGLGIGSSSLLFSDLNIGGLTMYPDPAGITAIDKSYICPALYKNVTFRCIIYSLTPQLSTISKYDLLVVLRDFVEERTGEIDSGGSDLNLVFSIVGENPSTELKTTNSYSEANNARKAQLKKDKIKDKVNLATSVVSTALSPVLKVVGL